MAFIGNTSAAIALFGMGAVGIIGHFVNAHKG